MDAQGGRLVWKYLGHRKDVKAHGCDGLHIHARVGEGAEDPCIWEGHSHLSSTRSLDTLRIVLTKLPGNFGVDNPIATWSGLQSIAGTDGNIKQQTHLQKVWENRHQPCRFLCAGPLYLGALIVGKMLS